MSGLLVRPFSRADEGAVRRICLENGRFPDRLRPADWLFEDYWTRYYTRIEPEHVWVAAQEGDVTGYLTASFDTARFRRSMKRRILPRMLIKSALTGALAEPRSRDFLLKRIILWNHPEPDPENFLRNFPAHLHVNLSDGFRGSGAGGKLMEACLAQARQERVAGIHLETLAENEGARRFFERAGFSEVATRYPFTRIDPAMKDRAVIVYGKSL